MRLVLKLRLRPMLRLRPRPRLRLNVQKLTMQHLDLFGGKAEADYGQQGRRQKNVRRLKEGVMVAGTCGFRKVKWSRANRIRG